MKITPVTAGKIKERYPGDAIKEYSKCSSCYCKLEIIRMADEKTSDRVGEALEKQIEKKEGQGILSNIKDGVYVIALAIEGRMLSSEELVLGLQKMGVGGTSQVVFVIGGSLGLSEAVMKRADYALSFSKMTFPHQLMRMALLKQICRDYRIIGGEPYYKQWGEGWLLKAGCTYPSSSIH